MANLVEGGDHALSTFRQWLVARCKQLRVSAARSKELAAIGLPDADVEVLCTAPHREGVAIVSQDRDVIVEGPSGGDSASGPRALFRVAPQGEVTTLMVGPSFEAIGRVVVPGYDDVVMLCTKNGRQGLYYGDCGFLGEGTFQRKPAASPLELHTVFTTTCGENEAVHVKPPSLFGDVLEVPIELEKVRLSRARGDEGDFCSQRRVLAYERFTVRYRFAAGHFTRVNDVPKVVEQALAKY